MAASGERAVSVVSADGVVFTVTNTPTADRCWSVSLSLGAERLVMPIMAHGDECEIKRGRCIVRSGSLERLMSMIAACILDSEF